ncbi:MAG: T9SS type A sorting domain-containing protein [Bacteroidetes bacterium]|nr:T9SS type A sorting domain-containing protein [Bacteroidota bacterium]
MNRDKIFMPFSGLSKCSILLCFVFSTISFQEAYSQVNRLWDYSYNPPNNYRILRKEYCSFDFRENVVRWNFPEQFEFQYQEYPGFIDDTGVLLDLDTTDSGSGYSKVIYDGRSHFIAAATLINDSLPISKIVVARIDTNFADKQFLIPDSSTVSPGYDVLDLSVLSNSNIVVASHWDAFPVVSLSLMCMDTTGAVLWERVDSSFQFSYDVKLLADGLGGLYAAGSGKDTSTADDFIFVSHYTASGQRDWFITYYSPAHFFADLTDLIPDDAGHLYASGTVMDTAGQRGFLMKIDTTGSILWNKPVIPFSYSRIIADPGGNIYGVKVPLNGITAFSIDKLDSSAVLTDSAFFQPNGYFASELGDIGINSQGLITLTGGLFVLSFPKSDLFLAAYDTSLNLLGYDIYDSLNLLGENAKSLVNGSEGSVYICGRTNYENQFETSTIGVVKYELPEIINTVYSLQEAEIILYPNPSSGSINIRFLNTQHDKAVFHIYNTTGREVFKTLIPESTPEMKFHSTLPCGFYTAILELGKARRIFKMCIVN